MSDDLQTTDVVPQCLGCSSPFDCTRPHAGCPSAAACGCIVGQLHRYACGLVGHVDPQRTSVRPLLTEVLTLSDEALVAFVDFVRLNNPQFTRDPIIIRRVFTAYLMSDKPPVSDGRP